MILNTNTGSLLFIHTINYNRGQTRAGCRKRETMAKKAKEVIEASVIDIGIAQEKMASELAVLIDGDIAGVVSDLAEHKREYQGGAFVVMDKVLRSLDAAGS